MHDPQPGETYRHFKGGLYEIVARSLREDTLEPLVTYRSLEDGECWTRTLENFNGSVTKPRWLCTNTPACTRIEAAAQKLHPNTPSGRMYYESGTEIAVSRLKEEGWI